MTQSTVWTDQYDGLSALDTRYWVAKLAPFLSENAFIYYKCLAERAGIVVQARHGLCPQSAVEEMDNAIHQVKAAAVEAEERTVTHHDIVALVHIIQTFLSQEAAPFVHRFATSYDIIDSARAMMYRDTVTEVLLPDIKGLLAVLIKLAVTEAETPQIGRTHLQHAVPITFGFMIAEFVVRIGDCLENIERAAEGLRGKFSGPVGAYNALTLVLSSYDIDPLNYEREVLTELGLQPGQYSKQTVLPEALTRLMSEVVILLGALANLAENMRLLQATEINEVGEKFQAGQAGSSAMPFKQNPITHENTLSIFKIVVPRLMTIINDLISDLQRDLTNSASSRTYGEILAYTIYAIGRMTKAMANIHVNREQMLFNLTLQKGIYAAEPLQNLMALQGNARAYEITQALAMQSRRTGVRFQELMLRDPDALACFQKLSEAQRRMLMQETAYSGMATQQTLTICRDWGMRIS